MSLNEGVGEGENGPLMVTFKGVHMSLQAPLLERRLSRIHARMHSAWEALPFPLERAWSDLCRGQPDHRRPEHS